MDQCLFFEDKNKRKNAQIIHSTSSHWQSQAKRYIIAAFVSIPTLWSNGVISEVAHSEIFFLKTEP